VLVYRGLGGGEFETAKSFNVGTDPIDVQVADMDGDTKLDVIVTNYGSNDLQILFGMGNASMLNARGARVQVGDGPVSAQVITHSGTNQLPDLLVTNSASNNVYMLSAVGGGFFNQTPTIFQTGQNPTNTFVGNFNGQMGFVTLNYNSNSLTFYSGFDPLGRRDIFSGGQNPLSAVAADMNSDGMLDLVVGNNGNGVFSVFNGSQSGLSLVNSFLMEGIEHPAALALAQLGQGNDLQLLALDEGDELVHVFNAGAIDGTTPPSTGFPALLNLSGTAILAGLLGSGANGFGGLFSLIGALGVAIEGFFLQDSDSRFLDGGGDVSRPLVEFFEHLGKAVTDGKDWLESTIKDLSNAVGVELKQTELLDAVEDVVSLLFPNVPLQAIPALFNNILGGSAQVKAIQPSTTDQAAEELNTEAEVVDAQANSESTADVSTADAENELPVSVPSAEVLHDSAVGSAWDDYFAAEKSFAQPEEHELDAQFVEALAESRESKLAHNQLTNQDRRHYALAAVMASLGAGGMIFRLRRREVCQETF
jgi:hypothetical protein